MKTFNHPKQENRSEYVKAVSKHVEEAIKHTGLELETVSLTSLNQAPVSVFDPSNTFDAEGLTQITEITQSRKKKRNVASHSCIHMLYSTEQ